MKNKQEEFGRIYDHYVDKIYRFVYVKVNSREVAEDLTSDSFLRCWQVYKNDQNGINNIQAFLYQIARNLVTDHYRIKGRTQTISTDDHVVSDPRHNIEETTKNKSDIDQVRIVLAGLNNKDYQDAVILRYVEDLSVSEIAEITGKTEENVRVLLHRALKSVKDKIEKC